MRIFYASAGPADLIRSHQHWSEGVHNPTEVSITFSGQIQDFCRDVGAQSYFVSVNSNVRTFEDGDFIIEHRPKRRREGAAFHLEEVRYGLSLLRTARRFRADLALLDSGITHYFMMEAFARSGIPVIPILHNTLWPAGFRPMSLSQQLVQRLDGRFWRNTPLAAIAVSPECERQVSEVSPGHHTPVYQTRAQFHPGYFAAIPKAPEHGRRPFQVMFIGRVDESKGVLDIPLMARRIEDQRPGLVHWVICGRGPALEQVKSLINELRVGHVVDVRGWVSLEELQEIYALSHAAIVPTRSQFAEGLAMTAAEAILAGRPLVTNSIVPALELLRPAAIEAQPNDPESHANAVLKLATDAQLYERLRAQCEQLAQPFYDRSMGLRSVLHRALAQNKRKRSVQLRQ